MSKQPKLMDLWQMREIIASHLDEIRDSIFFNSELAIIHGDARVFHLIIQQTPPFIINDHRFGIITRGEGDVNFNLQDRHVSAGTLVYLGPGTIISPIRFSPDLEIYGLALFPQFPMPFAQDQMPSAMNGQVRDFQLPASESDIATARHILDCLWHLVRQADYHRPTATALVAALMHHYNQLYRQLTDQLLATRSREQTIFDRFLQLVNQQCNEQHQLAYYADRLCLTQRYLGTVVRQTSGTTAKDWIDRALVTRIKIELRHTEKSAAQIADDFHFANPAFFAKFFRRLTGMTPKEYRFSS